MTEAEIEAAEAARRGEILRAAGLSADDPEAIDNLAYPIPAGVEVVSLTQNYDTSRTTGRKVRCGACAHHQWHYRGFVAELGDGRQALIGINCGERHYGAGGKWKDMRAKLSRRQDEVYLATRVGPVRDKIAECFNLLSGWDAPPSIRAYIRSSLPEFDDAITEQCVQNEGYLDIYVRRADLAGGPRGGDVTTIRHGRVPSPAGYVNPTSSRDVKRAITCLQAANRLLMTDNMRAWRDAFGELSRGRKHAEDALASAIETVRNWHIPWLKDACSYYTALEGEVIEFNGRTLTPQVRWGTSVACTIPNITGTLKPLEAALADWPRET